MRTTTATLLALALFSGGCSFIPQLDPIAAPVSGKFPGKGGGEVSPDIAWQKFFTDPRLRKIVSIALANNRDLRIAALNVEQSRAQYGISRSELFPDISGVAYSERRRGLGAPGSNGSGIESTTYNVSVGITAYELDFFGKVRSLNTAALERYFATDAARVSTQISLVAEIASQYLTERALLEQLELSTQTLQGMKQAYDIMQKRFDSGTVSQLDLSSMEVQVQTAERDLAGFHQQIAQIENSLVFLAGSPLPRLPDGRGLDGVILAPVRAGLPSDLLLRRPDIRAAEHNLRAANAEIGAARAAFFPSVSLTATGGSTSREFSQLFGAGSATWLFSPHIDIPIFAAGKLRGNLDALAARKNIQIATYEKAIQTGFREVADGLAARAGLDQRIAATVKLVAAQQTRTDLATARYDKGIDSYFEVLTATLDLYNARQALIQLRLSRAANAVNLYKALGGGW